MRVIVIGGSDQGRQVIDAIDARGDHAVVGVLDRAMTGASDVAGYPMLGRDDELRGCAERVGADGYVVAIGDNFARGAVLDRADAECADLTLITVAHPTAVIARDATIGAGSILLAGSVVSNGCVVGRGVLLGTRASIDHDVHVDDNASLGPGATTGGGVSIGRATAIGLGAGIIHGVTIGADTVVGAGALVLADLPAGVVAYGHPARVIRSRQPGDPYL
jgi:sugar O-acyltransferase (sialic acid O-acetyltransferase NeuD family)